MWLILDLSGDPIKRFPVGPEGWMEAVQWAISNGGEFDIVFQPHVRDE